EGVGQRVQTSRHAPYGAGFGKEGCRVAPICGWSPLVEGPAPRIHAPARLIYPLRQRPLRRRPAARPPELLAHIAESGAALRHPGTASFVKRRAPPDLLSHIVASEAALRHPGTASRGRGERRAGPRRPIGWGGE